MRGRHAISLHRPPLRDGKTDDIDGLTVTPRLVNHGNPGGPFFAYRIGVEGRVIAYTGDTEWSDALVEIDRAADLFVAEAYCRNMKVPLHLDLEQVPTLLNRSMGLGSAFG